MPDRTAPNARPRRPTVVPVARTLTAVALAALLAVPAVLAAQQRTAVPPPESVFGFKVGADSQLFDYEQSMAYFRRLALAAPTRVKIFEVGRTSFGRTMHIVVISSPQNLARLDHYRQINQRLAHPEGLTDSAARALAREGRVFVDISGGLHASEIAGSQHTPKIAYDIVSRAGEPEIAQVLDNVVFVLWPSINPDGQDIVVNWCRDQYAGKGGQMELYQKYIGHDNNRDSYMMNVVESRVIQRTWRDWEPQVIYVHHQSSPEPTRIWIPPFADPVGFRAPPIPARTINSIGTYIAQELDAHGQPGAAHALSTFDAYYPGYIDYMPVYQNIPAWWTETQGGSCATPKTPGDTSRFPADYRELRPTALYLSPWKGGEWHLVDAVDYMVTASRATLKFAAKFREEILYNRYQSGRDVIRKYRAAAPYAYIVPQQQRDPMAPVELLQRFAFHGVRIDQLDRDVAYGGTTYPRGTWVVPLDQEFGELVREVFEVQHYPDMGDDLPYDAAGWTLPFQMGVQVVEAQQPLPAEFRSAMKPVKGTLEPWGKSAEYPFTTNPVAAGIVPAVPGSVTGTGDRILVNPAENNGFRFVTKALAAGATLTYAPNTPGGARWVVTGLAPASAAAWARELAVHLERVATVPGVQTPTTRVALYKAAPGNMDEGWTEWLFDTHGVTYALIGPTDLQAGNLGTKYDVIVMGSQSFGAGGFGGRGGGGGGRGGRGGRGGADSSAAQAADARTQAVDTFLGNGGTVVAWNQGATAAATALRLPVRNVVAGLPRSEFFTGSSIMQVAADTAHPVMAGMPGLADVMVSNSPVFETTDGFDGAVIAKFTTAPLRSGYLGGAKYIQNHAAALDVRRGKGHAVLFAFAPQWRGQPTGSFRMVFNALFFGGEVSAAAKGTPGFFVPPTVP
ncbi:MAG: M14 metallopeptidase family protein [Gemmatimonadota bacterium]|nr:M14 metallopeptidase family protein [Gemmatimonadota bacterium]